MSLSSDLQDREWCKQPKGTDIIWRYMDFSKYVSLLTTETLWFSRVDKFEDPYEGMPTAKDLERLSKGNKRERSVVIEHFKEKSKKVFANCWYKNRGQSDAMWKLYPNSQQGVAIKSVVSDVRSAIKSSYEPIFANVHYIDWEQNRIPPNSVLAPSLHKREAFEHEKEMRILIRHESWDDLSTHPYARSSTPSGLQVQVELNDLIKEVFTSPKASEWFHTTVEDITGKYVSKPVNSSKLYDPISN